MGYYKNLLLDNDKMNDMQEDDHMNHVCPLCENTGIKEVSNGPDDIDHEFCTCGYGIMAQNNIELV